MMLENTHTFRLGDIHLGDIRLGGLPPSRGHPSRAAFLRLGDIRLGRPSSVSGTSVSGGLPPSRGHPSRVAFLRLGDIRLGAIRLRDWEGQDQWHRRMSLGRKAMKTEDPSVQAFPPRAIRLRHLSVPPVSWMSVSAFRLGDIRLGVIRLGVIRLGHIRLGHLRLGDSLQVKSRESTLISPHTALQLTTRHSFIMYSKTAITTKTCQTNLKTISIP